MISAVEFRRHLHRHPELSFNEERTAEYIEKCLSEAGISHSRIAKTGVLAKIEGISLLLISIIVPQGNSAIAAARIRTLPYSVSS